LVIETVAAPPRIPATVVATINSTSVKPRRLGRAERERIEDDCRIVFIS